MSMSPFGVEHPELEDGAGLVVKNMGPRTYRALTAALIGSQNVARPHVYADGLRRGFKAGRYSKTVLANKGMTADELRFQHLQSASKHYGHKVAGTRAADRGFGLGLRDAPARPSRRTVARAVAAGGASGAAVAAGGYALGHKGMHRKDVHKSAFGVEHSVSKSRRRDTAAAAAGAGAGGVVGVQAHMRTQLASAKRHVREANTHVTGSHNASPEGQEYHANVALRHTQAARVAARRFRSRPLLTAAGLGGAALGAAGAVGASRAAGRRVHKSAFGVEHPVSKAVRLDRALEATRKPAKVKLAQVKTPLADARFGPVQKGAVGVVDDALVTPARVRVAGAKPQKQVPPAEAKPAKPLGQRLNNAIAATGGPSS